MLNIGGLAALQPKKVSVGAVILLIQLFLWISADFVYGQYAGMVRDILIIYFLLFLVTRVTLGGRPSTVAGKNESWTNFLIIFIITAVILVAFSAISALGFFQEAAELTNVLPEAAVGVSALGFGALHAFVKAYIEEDAFRDAIPHRGGFGDVVSSILFGAFHFSVLFMAFLAKGFTTEDILGIIWVPITMLMVLGIAWAWIRHPRGGGFGVMGAVGSHFAWNLFAFGVLLPILAGGLA